MQRRVFRDSDHTTSRQALEVGTNGFAARNQWMDAPFGPKCVQSQGALPGCFAPAGAPREAPPAHTGATAPTSTTLPQGWRCRRS